MAPRRWNNIHRRLDRTQSSAQRSAHSSSGCGHTRRRHSSTAGGPLHRAATNEDDYPDLRAFTCISHHICDSRLANRGFPFAWGTASTSIASSDPTSSARREDGQLLRHLLPAPRHPLHRPQRPHAAALQRAPRPHTPQQQHGGVDLVNGSRRGPRSSQARGRA